MTLTTWSPVRGLASLEMDQLNRMFERAFGTEPLTGAWVPAVDLYETATDDIVAKLDLPDVKREDIKVSFENNVLTIEGERKLEADSANQTYRHAERGYGTFRRTFTLPSTVDAAKVQATYQDGVLTVTLPRREDSRPRQIPVTA